MREGKTRYAVLGLLAWKPMSGYDIRKHISDSVGHFWCESYGQIYPVLKELTEEGLATRSVEQQEHRPDRHVYSITDRGREEFGQWLAEPPEVLRHRVEVLLKLLFAKQGPVEDSIRHVQHFREQQTALFEHYTHLGGELREQYPDEPSLPFWLVTLRCGVHVSRAFLDWCDEAEAALKKMSAEAGPAGATGE